MTNQAVQEEQLFTDTNVTMKSGHLVKDAEVVGDGKFVKMRIASNKQYKTSEGEIATNTNYFNALVSSNLAESFDKAKAFKKGDWVYLKGEDSTRSFDTPEGYKQTASTIFAYHVVLKKESGSPTQGSKPKTKKSKPTLQPTPN
ncbi:MAG: single-stranded DNA-binding protein [Cyclobacteriaceae bacterium]